MLTSRMTKIVAVALAGATLVGTIGEASARNRYVHGQYGVRHYGYHRGYGYGYGPGPAVAGAALGVLGAAAAGVAANRYYNGYGYGPGYGYYAPGYGYGPGYYGY